MFYLKLLIISNFKFYDEKIVDTYLNMWEGVHRFSKILLDSV